MPGTIPVTIDSPTQHATVGRNLQVSGSIKFNGTVTGVEIELGGNVQTLKPTFSIDINHSASWKWNWAGLVPTNIRPGEAFQIAVNVLGKKPADPDFDGQATMLVTLEHVVPTVVIDPFRSPLVVTSAPATCKLNANVKFMRGDTVVDQGIYGPPQVQYQVGNGTFTSLDFTNGLWETTLTLQQPGDYPITVRATDQFGSVDTKQQTLTVLLFQMPAVIDPAAKKTFSGVPTTASITSWTRLEPQCANADIGVSSNARLFDPLWLMTRQWQIGEFQGEDTGSLVQARVRATNAALTRCYFGELSANTAAPPYDPTRAPLEALVERRRMRADDDNDSRMLTLAVDAGLHFLRMLELNATGKKYRPAFLAKYTMQPLPSSPAPIADDATLRFVQTMVGRAPDARLLVSAFRHATPQIVFDPSLNIAAADVAAVQQIAAAWLAWYDDLFTEPTSPADDAWNPERLEYAVSVATQLSAQPEDALTYSASEFDGGRLDWSSFDVNVKSNIDTTGDHAFVALNETTIPAPVTFRGAPAARFWELEDASIAYGLLSAGPTDLAHLLMIEYASSYGNDWYVIPLTIPVGTVTRVDSLVVTDTFGVRSLLRPIGDPALPSPYFSMWQSANMRSANDLSGAPVLNRFLLPPTIGRSIDGAPLEDVLFMRDEMANLAWGIERSIESPIETPVNLANGSAAIDVAPSSATPAASGAAPRYLLATTVPDNWIPLLPVQLHDHGKLVSWLKRGAVLHPDSTRPVPPTQSEVLNALASLLLYDEEIPREGVHVTRRRRYARGVGGSHHLWTAFRNEVGRGEGSAGLRFDQLEGEVQP
jgi:hypothetical protein